MYTSLDDNDDGFYDNYISRVSLPPSIIPITTPTTATLPTSTLSNVTKTTTPSLRDTPSRSVSFDDDYPSSASFGHQQHADKQHETGWGVSRREGVVVAVALLKVDVGSVAVVGVVVGMIDGGSDTLDM